MSRASIRAIVKADDGQRSVEFDAQKWFEQASGDDMIRLAGIGWGGDWEADAVAEFVAKKDRNVRAVLDYCHDNEIGFEVYIYEKDANDWLRLCRPLVQDRLRAQGR